MVTDPPDPQGAGEAPLPAVTEACPSPALMEAAPSSSLPVRMERRLSVRMIVLSSVVMALLLPSRPPALPALWTLENLGVQITLSPPVLMELTSEEDMAMGEDEEDLNKLQFMGFLIKAHIPLFWI